MRVRDETSATAGRTASLIRGHEFVLWTARAEFVVDHTGIVRDIPAELLEVVQLSCIVPVGEDHRRLHFSIVH